MQYGKSSMSSKYQVTIPADERAELHIDSPDYDIVWIKIPSGDFLIKPRKKLEKDENPFLRVFGMFEGVGGGTVVDEFINEKKEEALRENL